MKEWENKLNFQAVIKLLFMYQGSPARFDPKYKWDLVGEIIDRVWQTELLIKKIIMLEKRERFMMKLNLKWVTLLHIPAPRFITKGSLQREKEIQTYTEAYYYFAFRSLKIFNELPQLNHIRAGKMGVTIVRNKLIEHPEVTIRSFGYLGKNGPVVKAGRYEHDKDLFVDQGLYKNANDLLSAMGDSLRQYLNIIESKS